MGGIGNSLIAVSLVVIVVVSTIATQAIADLSHTTVDSTGALSSWPGSNYQSGHGNAGPPGHGGPPGHDRGADARNVTVPDLNSSASALVVARDRALTLAEEYPDSTNDFERVAENRSLSLQDTDGDGIPDAVEEMDLRMPTGGPGVVGEPLYLDPFVTDTSGDGILDNETADVNYRIIQKDNETKLHAQVTYARSHPARVDTTGNGLTDREQIEGREIQYTPDKEHTRRLMEDLEAAADLSELGYPDEYFRIETVTSNPLVEDTNGDGLSDREERQLGTDPRDRDTTGDGITDRRALEGDADPTLYDITPPELDIYYVAWEKPPWSFDTNYAVQFAAEDQAGLDCAAVFRGGEEGTSHTLSGRHDSVRSEFTTGAFDTITDFYSGTSVTVEASDRK